MSYSTRTIYTMGHAHTAPLADFGYLHGAGSILDLGGTGYILPPMPPIPFGQGHDADALFGDCMKAMDHYQDHPKLDYKKW